MAEQIGTNKNFNMPVDEIIHIALQGLGGDHISSEEARLARTALNLLFVDLQNRGMAPLSSMELTEISLVSGSSQGYTLGTDIFSVLEGVIEVSTVSSKTDLNVERISYTDWLKIPTKQSTKGKPTQYLINLQESSTQVNFWPVPTGTNLKFKAWVLRNVSKVEKSYELVDFPRKYLPAIVNGLRYYMATLRGASIEDKTWLKQEYYETLQSALEEDREKTSLRVYPYRPRVL